MKNKLISFCIPIALMVLFGSCKKLLDVGTPLNQLTTDKVFADTATAEAALVSAYAQFNVNVDPNLNKYMDIYGDELIYPSTSQSTVDFNLSTVSVTNGINLNIWEFLYSIIYKSNDIMTQAKRSSLPASTTSMLINETKFLRAYAYFYLTNLYGNVPLLLSTDVNLNARATQSDALLIYKQIIADLTDAQAGLPVTYRGTGKVRANKWAAAALLAKVYLFQGDWVNAEAESSMVINSNLYTPLTAPSTVFLANSQETILSFFTVNGFIQDAQNLIPSTGAPQYPASSVLINSFEPGDLRKSNWLKSTTVGTLTYNYPFKYHNRALNTTTPEYLIALRAGEQYLIRAEARAQQNDISNAIGDLNVIRKRAGLTALPSTLSQSACLTAIFHERQVEMFTENANRFLDLKRTGTLNASMSAYKTTWTPTAALLPVPQNEITYDNNLKQNPGY